MHNLLEAWEQTAIQWSKETGGRVMVGGSCPSCYRVLPREAHGVLVWPDIKYCACGNSADMVDVNSALFKEATSSQMVGFSNSDLKVIE